MGSRAIKFKGPKPLVDMGTRATPGVTFGVFPFMRRLQVLFASFSKGKQAWVGVHRFCEYQKEHAMQVCRGGPGAKRDLALAIRKSLNDNKHLFPAILIRLHDPMIMQQDLRNQWHFLVVLF